MSWALIIKYGGENVLEGAKWLCKSMEKGINHRYSQKCLSIYIFYNEVGSNKNDVSKNVFKKL